MTDEKLVTGYEAGLDGIDQIRIALQTIIANGGVAETHQIYVAVDAVLQEKGFRLSEQGKASLRFFVNAVAVRNGYIYPYDREDPGWRVTPEGEKLIEGLPVGKVMTEARGNFEEALSDIRILLASYEHRGDLKFVGSGQSFEIFLRAGVILAVTAWETFIEDTLTAHFKRRMTQASAPTDIPKTFNKIAQAWFGTKPKYSDLATWTGEGWKEQILSKFEQDIATLNTPSSDNIEKLFEKYLDLDIEQYWSWQGMSSERACQKLDELIQLRGQLAHRGWELGEERFKVSRNQLKDVMNLIERLVGRTEAALDGFEGD